MERTKTSQQRGSRMTCRCGHAWCHHPTGHECVSCCCPEFRHAETRDSITLQGVKP